jgi:hypothetical protein
MKTEETKKIKLAEYVPQVGETLSDGAHEVAEMLGNYEDSNSYICDAINEHADSMVDVYNCDLLDWAKSHLGDIADARAEFGAADDIIHDIMAAQYKVNSDALYEELEAGGRFFALKVAAREVEEITPEQLDALESLDIDNNDRVGDLVDQVLEIVKPEEEE